MLWGGGHALRGGGGGWGARRRQLRRLQQLLLLLQQREAGAALVSEGREGVRSGVDVVGLGSAVACVSSEARRGAPALQPRSHLHASANVCIRQHTSAYVEHTSSCWVCRRGGGLLHGSRDYTCIRLHTSAYVSIRRVCRRGGGLLHGSRVTAPVAATPRHVLVTALD
jgi:hypothetical protein